ncbi:MAG: enoyl-CoA hydratase/isomerase family protein [Bacteroidetes bacterium]|nr:enoyl-CoA hydratase/isomerase family protein [Bacteroidota bacterium]
MEPFVSTEVSAEGIGTITFFHPSSNSLPSNILNDLAVAISTAGSRHDIRVIVLQSGGDRTFCAGASFDELVAIEDESAGLAFFSGFAHVINAMRTCPKLIVGRVQGKAVGGGVGLAASVDICLATQHASVKLSELAVGIGPFVVGPAVERKLGLAGMSALAIDARSWKSAAWAATHGLYAEVFETTEALDNEVQRLSMALAASNPEAMSELKSALWSGTEHWDTLLFERAAISGALVRSDFTKKAIAAFKS